MPGGRIKGEEKTFLKEPTPNGGGKTMREGDCYRGGVRSFAEDYFYARGESTVKIREERTISICWGEGGGGPDQAQTERRKFISLKPACGKNRGSKRPTHVRRFQDGCAKAAEPSMKDDNGKQTVPGLKEKKLT